MNFTPFEISDISILSLTQQILVGVNPVPGDPAKRQETKTVIVKSSGVRHDFTELTCEPCGAWANRQLSQVLVF